MEIVGVLSRGAGTGTVKTPGVMTYTLKGGETESVTRAWLESG